MQIDKSFVVHAPAPAVWDFLIDPDRVARCMPGAAITGKVDDSTWAGTITVKVGPVLAAYKGKLSFARVDPAARTAEILASGQETRGKGGASMKLTSRVAEQGPGETEVTASSEINVTGILAQMGRGMIQDVGDQLFARFTTAMRAELESSARAGAPPGGPAPGEAPKTAAAPVDVVSLGAGAAMRAAGRTLRRPEVWIAVAALALLVGWLVGRSRG